jgi:hypothetical protein
VITRRDPRHALPHLFDYAGTLMPEHHGGNRDDTISMENVEIGTAHARSGNSHGNLALLWTLDVQLFDHERLVGLVHYRCAHEILL